MASQLLLRAGNSVLLNRTILRLSKSFLLVVHALKVWRFYLKGATEFQFC